MEVSGRKGSGETVAREKKGAPVWCERKAFLKWWTGLEGLVLCLESVE